MRGLVVEAFGSGNVPILENSFVPVLERAAETDVPVVVVSQSPRGLVDLEAGTKAAPRPRARARSARAT